MAIQILVGDCRERLKDLPDASVNCCVTSPPYFGLRDYGTGQWEGGDPECKHGVSRWEGPKQTQGAQSGHASKADRLSRHVCACGAARIDRQIGLESTPDEFVAAMVEVFREVKRVLRDDGTLWLNIGDSYNASPAGNKTPSGFSQTRPSRRTGNGDQETVHTGRQLDLGCKPKDLIGIPWMLAFALRADGWFLRQDIIWSKPNPMPESVRDRCTKAHEYLFLLSKGPRYYYDADAVAEKAKDWSSGGPGVGIQETQHYGAGNGGNSGLKRIAQRYKDGIAKLTRNRRSVWTIPTQAFGGAHFATFPPALVEPCLLAGCPDGGTVLDPFFGAGTTGLVANRFHRSCIGIELNPEYAAMAKNRIEADGGMFSTVEIG
jgi:DNA modification methylase